MASNGAQQAYAPILAALATMTSNDRTQKDQAFQYLEKFQKSPEAWTMSIEMIQSESADAPAKLFAGTTLKGKIVYDLHQIPRESLPGLRDTLLQNLVVYRSGPKPLRTVLAVCLANLAIQMTEWKDVLPLVVSTLGTDPQTLPCVLEFLKVLPEEVTEGRKINLTEDELIARTTELLVDNAQQALSLLIQYSQSSVPASQNPQLLECITSWIKELPLNDIINSPLLKVIFDDLLVDPPFEQAVECLCTIFHETRDVDECMSMIQTLYPHVVALRPMLIQAAKEEDSEKFKGFAKIFAEAGTCWVVLIARQPEQLRPLVEGILETAALDRERDAISHTFSFWYELKQYLTLENFMQARLEFVDVYSKLVDIMIGHLEYPKPESDDEKADLFDGDRELEEKFREFRHQMGDVLKDCCEVIGVTDCLGKSYTLIESWVQTYGPQASANHVPEWQKLEAPLFSLRAMGRMVPAEESIMLPRLIPLIVQIPDHEKVRFQAVMALGRYTEWTSYHSDDMLQPQLQYIMASFQHPSKEVVRAAALSFKFFCNDCAKQLTDYIEPLQAFYSAQLDNLPTNSQEEITDGVASVLGRLPADRVYEQLQAYCNPIISSLIQMAQHASNDKEKALLADKISLVTLFVQWVQPHCPPPQEHPAVKYCQEIFPVLSAIAENYRGSSVVLEAVCRCWRYMVLSYRTAMAPLLAELATQLANGFSASKQGSFLWATDSIVREFSEGVDSVDETTTNAIFAFYEQQATTFLHIMNDSPPEELPDLIDDFFRLAIDMLLYFSAKTLTSPLMPSILAAACSALTLLAETPIFGTLHFLRDLLAYGGDFAPSSSFSTPSDNTRATVPPALRDAVSRLVATHGEHLVQRIMTGMMYTFPRDCFPDASGVLLDLFQIAPEQVALWVQSTVGMLPPGSITQQESDRLLGAIRQRVQSGEIRKVRGLLQDFTNSYRRRNVAPREGLGRLEGRRFKFGG